MKWFVALPLEEAQKTEMLIASWVPCYTIASFPAALEAKGRERIGPWKGGGWLRNPHGPVTEVGLERTQQVWAAESW